MQYKGSLILACASITLLASAAPQSDVAVTGAAAKSTMTMTKVATATVGGAGPAAATGGAEAAGAVGAIGASGYDTSGAGAGVGAGAGSSSGGADDSMPPTGSGSGAGVGGGLSDGKGFPGGGDWENSAGKGPDSEKGPFWGKLAGSNGHPHQPVARGWSDWFGGAAGKEQAGEKRPEGMGMRESTGVAGHGQGRMLRVRGDIVTGGPSWAHVRDGAIGSVKVARSIPMGGQGHGGMSYAGERQGGSRRAGYGH